MTVAVQVPTATFLGNGTASGLNLAFQFLDNSHLVVTKIASDGGQTILVEGSDYSVSGSGLSTGGVVTPLAVIAIGDQWKVERATPREQVADYAEGDDFPAASHEGALDRDMMIEQEQDEIISNSRSRSVLVPDGETAPDFASLAGLTDGDQIEYRDNKLQKRDVSSFAGKFYAGDAEGKPVASEGIGSDADLRTDLAAPTGSSLQGFRAAGSDQAVLSTQTKLQQIVDTRDYGTGALTLANWQLSKAHRDDIVLDARQSGMISAVSGSDNRLALQDMDAWAETKGGKKILLPTGTYPMDGTFEPSGENSFEGAGGSLGQTVIELQATDAPGWWIKERSCQIKGIQFTNSTARTAKAVTDVLVNDLHIGDVDGGATTISRVELEDIYFTNSAYSSLMITSSWEMGYLNNISGADGMGFGVIIDDGTRLGYTNKALAAFETRSSRIRMIEYALKGAILGHASQTNRGLHNILEIFECLGCCWDRATLTSLGMTTHQMDIYMGNTRLIQPDFEDQQYDQTVTSSTGMTRTANATPAKGIQCLSTGGHIEGGHFSSLEECASIVAPGWNVVGNPAVFAGDYGVAMTHGFQFSAAATKFHAEGISQSGTTKLFDCRNEYGTVFYDGYEYIPTSSSVLGPGIRINHSPLDATISGGVLTTTNKHITVRGEGAASDSVSTFRRAAGLNGVSGDEVILYPGAETITLVDGSVIDNHTGANRTLDRPMTHKYQPTTWYGEA